MAQTEAIDFVNSSTVPPSRQMGTLKIWSDIERCILSYDADTCEWCSDLGAGFMPVSRETANIVLKAIGRIRRRKGQ